MDDMMDIKLAITTEDGNRVVVNVLDIIDSYTYNKTFLIYTFANENKSIFASILNESDTSYSVDTITNQDEINYINSEINRFSSELVEAN